MQTRIKSRRRPIAVVTGASAGAGRAIAVRFAEAGYDVGLIARGRERLESAGAEIEAAGGRALVLPADVADADAVFAAADRVIADWGPIDVWVNAAMVTIYAPVDRIRPEEFKRVTDVTYLGQVHGTLAALRHMRARGRGTIVQIGSALSYRAIPLQSAYCAAKFAVRGFTDALRCELLHEGSRIRITMVQLPAVNTPQFDWARSRLPRQLEPVPPIFQPEAIAAAVIRAVPAAPRELWIGWSAVRAMIGTMIAPGVLDRLSARYAWIGQMTGAPARPDRPDNLDTAPPGDPGAHGRFDAVSHPHVLAVSATQARAGLAVLASCVAGCAVIALSRATRRPRGGAVARR